MADTDHTRVLEEELRCAGGPLNADFASCVRCGRTLNTRRRGAEDEHVRKHAMSQYILSRRYTISVKLRSCDACDTQRHVN